MIWDLQRIWSDLPSLRGAEANQVTRVACSKGDRRLLAVGYSDGTLSIWEDMYEVARIHAHDKWISGLVFTPDGKSLTTAAEDGGQVRFWKLEPVLNLRLKSPQHATDTIPLGLDGRPNGTKEGLKTNARWNEALASEASARASLDKAGEREALAMLNLEQMKALDKQGAADAKLVEEADLRLTVAENDVLAAKADVALAEARKKLAEVAFERESLKKAIDHISAVARNQDEEPAMRAYRRHDAELEHTELELTRDAAVTGMQRAKAKLAQAKASVSFRTNQLDRLRMLHEKHALEQRIVREAEVQLKDAEADQQSAQVAVIVAKAHLTAAEESLKARKDP